LFNLLQQFNSISQQMIPFDEKDEHDWDLELHNKFHSSSFMLHLWKIMIKKCQSIMFNLFPSYHYRMNFWSILKISTLCKSTSMSLSIVGFIIVLYLWPQLAWCTKLTKFYKSYCTIKVSMSSSLPSKIML
jgi:hypothetical protein